MAIFRRKDPQVINAVRSSGTNRVTKTKKVGRDTVEITRVTNAPEKEKQGNRKASNRKQRPQQRQRNKPSGGRNQRSRTRARAGHHHDVPPPLPEAVRKQMLVRVLPHQTQVVVLEGPTLVEHFVANEDSDSMAGNVYLAIVKNVLPGMEAAFLDFGAEKNGVLYAGDLKAPAGAGKNPRIESVLRNGDKVLVQVVKDAMGAKGARLTGEISMPGRYLVLVPDSDVMGISRRLPDDERHRLRDAVKSAKPKGFGVIVRTAAAGASEEDLAADIARLVEKWDKIKDQAGSGQAPRTIYKEPELLIRVIREHFTSEFRRLLIDNEESAKDVVEYLQETAPAFADRVKVYEDDLPLFDRYHVEDQLQKALERRVYLKSGGHLVIDRTEALTVIDVNTGKFVGKSSLEETVFQNNIEAAEEIGRQLRLRDIGGIIVVDFIDMESEKNNRQLMQKVRETLARDKTRTQVFDVGPLGLVEMTRKNVSRSLLENFSEECPTCDGRGVVLKEKTPVFQPSDQ
jgi:ribonuclease E